ncbi:MAG: glycosyltransferase family 4 protein [Acidimicrobiales bacterium]
MPGPGALPGVAVQPRLRVALDATPLLGLRTGVGEFCLGAMTGLAGRTELDVAAFAISWRRRQALPPQVPPGIRVIDRAMPAKPLHRAWRGINLPPIEWLTGPIDVVHGTNFVVPPSRRAVRVVTVHDLTTVRFPQMCDDATQAFPGLIRRALADGAWVHTPSRFVAEEVVELLGADPHRVRAVSHGIPALALDPPEPVPSLVGRPYILALGTIEPRKDMVGLIQAFDAVAGAHPDLVLVLAGRPGWLLEPFERAREAARWRDRIVSLGYVSPGQRRWLLDSAWLFAFPSLYEGFGFPALEAMASGVPVVATTAGALPETLGSAARLCPPGDPEALAGALEEVIGDEGERTRLVDLGLAHIGRFSWEACGAGLARLYADAFREGTDRGRRSARSRARGRDRGRARGRVQVTEGAV